MAILYFLKGAGGWLGEILNWNWGGIAPWILGAVAMSWLVILCHERAR